MFGLLNYMSLLIFIKVNPAEDFELHHNIKNKIFWHKTQQWKPQSLELKIYLCHKFLQTP